MNKDALKLATLSIAGAISATPIQFTVTGTANDNSFGYIQGNSYSFSFVLNENYTGGSRDNFTTTENVWAPAASDPVLFSSISGDGISGNFTPVYPSGRNAKYNIHIEKSADDDEFAVTISTDMEGEDIGLSANGNMLSSIEFGMHDPSGVLLSSLDASDESFQNPNTYWGGYIGTYSMGANDELFFGSAPDLWDNPSQGIWFTPTSLTIEAIPEPTTMVLMVPMMAGLMAYRRRKELIAEGIRNFFSTRMSALSTVFTATDTYDERPAAPAAWQKKTARIVALEEKNKMHELLLEQILPRMFRTRRCPCCDSVDAITRIARNRLLMRMIPNSKRFYCRRCGVKYWSCA